MGRFITIEGPDGSGKTLHAARLATAIRDRGHDVLLTREPGGTALGDQIRALLMATDGEPLDPVADALLFNAARAQHVATVIRPALATGRVVVCARYADSTIAYQGWGSGVDLALLQQIIAIATGGLVPDLTVLLDLDAERGLERKTPEQHTRFETSFDLAFHRRVRQGFLALAALEPARWRVIDADRPADEVFASVLAAVAPAVEIGIVPRARATPSEPTTAP